MRQENIGEGHPQLGYSAQNRTTNLAKTGDLAETLLVALQHWAQTAMLNGNWSSEEDQLAAIAQSEYNSRRRRDQYFDADIFAEPAWDMLLDLYIQHCRKRAVSVHSLCIASAVPATTALRWIGKLVDCGLAVRLPSEQDARVIHVELTENGLRQMGQYLRGRSGRIAPPNSMVSLS